MITLDAHLTLKHAGTQATLYAIRGRYWPSMVAIPCVELFTIVSHALRPSHAVLATRWETYPRIVLNIRGLS